MKRSATDLAAVLNCYRFSEVTEDALQLAVQGVFERERIAFKREHQLSREDRIDFMCARVGVECKIKGGLSAVTRQLHRYAQSDEIDELLLVTTRVQLARLPASINGKPVKVFASLGGLL